MTQISRKWISDRAIDHTKLDGSDSYTMRGLVVTTDATISGGLSLGGPIDLSGATISNISVTDATVSNNLKTGKINALTDTIIFYGDATFVPTNGTEITLGGLGGSKSKIGADSGYLRVSSGDAKIDLNDSDSTYVEITGKDIILTASEATIINSSEVTLNSSEVTLNHHAVGNNSTINKIKADTSNGICIMQCVTQGDVVTDMSLDMIAYGGAYYPESTSGPDGTTLDNGTSLMATGADWLDINVGQGRSFAKGHLTFASENYHASRLTWNKTGVDVSGESINLVGDATFSNLGGRSLYFHTYNGDDPNSFRMLVDSGNIRLDTPTTNLQLGSGSYTNTVYLNGESINLVGDATISPANGSQITFGGLGGSKSKIGADSGYLRISSGEAKIDLNDTDSTYVEINGKDIILTASETTIINGDASFSNNLSVTGYSELGKLAVGIGSTDVDVYGPLTVESSAGIANFNNTETIFANNIAVSGDTTLGHLSVGVGSTYMDVYGLTSIFRNTETVFQNDITVDGDTTLGHLAVGIGSTSLDIYGDIQIGGSGAYVGLTTSFVHDGTTLNFKNGILYSVT